MNETQNAVSAAPNPQAALLQIAISLDRLHDRLAATPVAADPWGEWSTEHTGEPGSNEVLLNADEVLIYAAPLPDQSTDAYNKRFTFAHKTLGVALPEATEYAERGPVWYHGMFGDLVKQYGRAVHVAMIQDAETYDPQGAAEMGRVLLKSTESGMAGGVMLGEGNVG